MKMVFLYIFLTNAHTGEVVDRIEIAVPEPYCADIAENINESFIFQENIYSLARCTDTPNYNKSK